MARTSQVLSSLPFQLLIWFNRIYMAIYAVLELAIFFYKGVYLRYPVHLYGLELSGLIFLILIDYLRTFLGSKGNKAEQVLPMVFFLILILFTAFGGAYYIRLQVYVLRAEMVLNIIYLAFLGVELILGFFVLLTFAKGRKEYSA
mmetsp:Transcript_20024/g.51100  ORF Transcript_20024/g.51100 Transcript_20024/m.51100 type:complete len:145 (-) Transcript_20024:183-617(-)|eukprot:CAMPEP_0113902728 /NCGR_PEP_ID=MMETSP0780_2-20120614/22023_1 /TAXON_ID=652834 /ORGANISM="Palpitomonas bilix" /LENGTH=144 /DNA_ID=CAMNT_0000895589 /DNA_START=152 /DNA_END=586 /DNA_ORIENTATION=+ /assembly_acc=CAM_ASM_000599